MESSEFVKTAKRIIREKPEVFEALLEFERTKKLPKTLYHQRINLTIRNDVLKSFKRYCEERDLNMSAIVESFMQEAVRKK